MDKKWNLQDIRPAGESKRTRRPVAAKQSVPLKTMSEPRDVPNYTPQPTTSHDEDGTMRIDVTDGNKKKRKRVLMIVVVLLLIFGGIIGSSFLLKGADVTVFPRHREPNVNAIFTAYKTPQTGELSYEIITLEAEGERQVSATGQQDVTEQATGFIQIYKTSAGTQRLIKNTRFEDTKGHVYRITESLIVPGAVDDNPGSIRAEVFADEAGEGFNAPAGTRFTIPGLESDKTLFNAMYAENEESFIGGFSGQKFIIDETELATAKQALQMELRNALLERLPNEQPAGFIAFSDAVALTYESLPAVEYGDNLATIKEKAVLQIPLFKDVDFASYIAAATIPGYENLPVRIDDHAAFSFGYTGATTSAANIANMDSLEFQLVGRPQIVWTYDAGKLATDLLGSNKTALNQVLQGYPAIERARAEIRPFWKRTFPTNLSDIKIDEQIEDADTE